MTAPSTPCGPNTPHQQVTYTHDPATARYRRSWRWECAACGTTGDSSAGFLRIPANSPITDVQELRDYYEMYVPEDNPDGVMINLDVFLDGQCHAFALAMHERAGWPLVEVWAGGEPQHFMVKAPDGRLVDITGAMTVDEAMTGWHASKITDVHPDDVPGLRTPQDMENPITELARRAITTVLPEVADVLPANDPMARPAPAATVGELASTSTMDLSSPAAARAALLKAARSARRAATALDDQAAEWRAIGAQQHGHTANLAAGFFVEATRIAADADQARARAAAMESWAARIA